MPDSELWKILPVSGAVKNKATPVLTLPAVFLLEEERRGMADFYLMSPSFSYSSWILFSDNCSLLVFFFLLREQVSLKLRGENEQMIKENTLLRPRDQILGIYWTTRLLQSLFSSFTCSIPLSPTYSYGFYLPHYPDPHQPCALDYWGYPSGSVCGISLWSDVSRTCARVFTWGRFYLLVFYVSKIISVMWYMCLGI